MTLKPQKNIAACDGYKNKTMIRLFNSMLTTQSFFKVGVKFLILTLLLSFFFWRLSIGAPALNIDLWSDTAGMSQLFLNKDNSYSEENSIRTEIRKGQNTLRYPLPIVNAPLRWDPLEQSATVKIYDSYVTIFGIRILPNQVSLASLHGVEIKGALPDRATLYLEEGVNDPQVSVIVGDKAAERARLLFSAVAGLLVSLLVTMSLCTISLVFKKELEGFFLSVEETLREAAATYREAGFLALLNRHQKSFSFLTIFTFLIGLHYANNVIAFPYDADSYWRLGNPAVLSDFPKTIRGYLFPLLLAPAHYFANLFPDFWHHGFRIYSSLIYGFVLTNVVPPLYQALFGGKITFLRRLIAPVLIAAIFPGLIIYPLSDLPALLLMLGAVALLVGTLDWNSKSWKTIGLIVTSGVLAGAAYNTRTIYLFPIVCLLLSMPTLLLRNKPVTDRVLLVSAFVAGAYLISIPQVIINQKHRSSFNPMVVAEVGSGNSLFASQLMWGITIQRYETSIASSVPAPSVFYLDRAGEKLFELIKFKDAKFDLSMYFALLVSHPLDFLAIYTRHFLNGMDVRDGEVYTNRAIPTINATFVINYLVLFIGFWSVYIRKESVSRAIGSNLLSANKTRLDERKKASDSWPFWLFLLLLPVIAIVPGAIETRFFLPLHLLLYCTIAFNVSMDEIKESLSSNRFMLATLFVLAFCVFLTFSLTTMANMQHKIPSAYMSGKL